MKVRVPFISLALMAAVVACTKPSPVAKGANAIMAVPAAANDALPTPAGGPPQAMSNASAHEGAPQADRAIPADFQGRWGLTPQDCTSALAAAKGLLIINGNELRFYESRATPTGDVHRARTTLTGDFHFTGEGKTWTKFERLDRNKDTLVRTESDPAASFTYAKC